jgi:hypothetical protein
MTGHPEFVEGSCCALRLAVRPEALEGQTALRTGLSKRERNKGSDFLRADGKIDL